MVRQRICYYLTFALISFSILLALKSVIVELKSEIQVTKVSSNNICVWKKNNHTVETYYVNMDKSVSRRHSMDAHLTEVNLQHYRIRGILPKQLFFPNDVGKNGCVYKSSWEPHYNSSFQKPSKQEKYAVVGLCNPLARIEHNIKELAATSAHLYAIRKAIYSTTAVSRYALIMEDDMFIPFDVDFEELAASAPKGFGVLQLSNFMSTTLNHSWNEYIIEPNNPTKLWVPTINTERFEYWGAGLYLIDRVVLRPIIDEMVRVVHGKKFDWVLFKLIAGTVKKKKCIPKECCNYYNATAPKGFHRLKPTVQTHFNRTAPCVLAPYGYTPDSLVFAMTSSFTLAFSLTTNGIGWNISNLHQDHVEFSHRKCFSLQRSIANQLLSGNVSLPEFIKPACAHMDNIAF